MTDTNLKSGAHAGTVLALVCAVASIAPAGTFDDPRVIQASSPGNIRFGAAMDSDNGLLVIGAPGNRTSDAGSVSVYHIETGTLLRTLEQPGSEAPGDDFGASVAIDYPYVIVGTPGEWANVREAGRAYVFDVTDGSPVATLQSPTRFDFDRFGSSVDIHGTTAIVGAPSANNGARNAGAAFVFDITDASLIATLNHPDPDIDDRTGTAVAINETLIAIGAPGDDDAAVDAGTVLIYDHPGVTFQRALTPASDTPVQRFGTSVALEGGRLLVGAPGDLNQRHANLGILADPLEQLATRTHNVGFTTLGDSNMNQHASRNDMRNVVPRAFIEDGADFVGVAGVPVVRAARGPDTISTFGGVTRFTSGDANALVTARFDIDGPFAPLRPYTGSNRNSDPDAPESERRLGWHGSPFVLVGDDLNDWSNSNYVRTDLQSYSRLRRAADGQPRNEPVTVTLAYATVPEAIDGESQFKPRLYSNNTPNAFWNIMGSRIESGGPGFELTRVTGTIPASVSVLSDTLQLYPSAAFFSPLRPIGPLLLERWSLVLESSKGLVETPAPDIHGGLSFAEWLLALDEDRFHTFDSGPMGNDSQPWRPLSDGTHPNAKRGSSRERIHAWLREIKHTIGDGCFVVVLQGNGNGLNNFYPLTDSPVQNITAGPININRSINELDATVKTADLLHEAWQHPTVGGDAANFRVLVLGTHPTPTTLSGTLDLSWDINFLEANTIARNEIVDPQSPWYRPYVSFWSWSGIESVDLYELDGYRVGNTDRAHLTVDGYDYITHNFERLFALARSNGSGATPTAVLYDTQTWETLRTYAPSEDATPSSAFGDAVTINDTLLAIGAPLDRSGGGSITIYDASNQAPLETIDAESIGTTGALSPLGAIDGTHLVVGVPGLRRVVIVDLTDLLACDADFDNDGDVDLTDFGAFGAAFNTSSAEPSYNEAADFDNDSDVDLTDFGTFGAQFNRMNCP